MKSILMALLIAVCASAYGININDTRLLTDPAVSGDHIAFAYANDLWVANLDGSNVRRLTSHPGVESGPRFSPDGSMIAFTGRYEGNVDVYVVPTAGGVPKRLTFHPLNDVVLGFTPDGSAVLFTSPREVYTRRFVQLFTVPVTGGSVTKLPIPNAFKATYSPDGRKIVYQPIGDAFIEWKRYRGGQVARLMIFDTATNAVEQIPQPATRSNDTDPMWIGDKVYFRSDRSGEFNLFSYDPKSKQVEQLTRYTDWPVIKASAGGGRIAFERGGYLSLFEKGLAGEAYNLGSGRATRVHTVLDELRAQCRVPVEVDVDPRKLRPREIDRVVGSIEKIGRDTGWRPEIPLRQTLVDLLEYWRQELVR